MSESDKKQGPNQEPGNTPPIEIPIEGIAPSGKSTLRIVRDGIFKQAKKTLQYLDESEKDKTIKVRVDDQRSGMFLIIGLAIVAVFVTGLFLNPGLPNEPAWRPVFFGLGLVGDLFLGASVVWYVTSRFGILRKFDPRFAVLVFQLLLGTGIMFAYFAFNAVIFFLSVVYKWGPIVPAGPTPPGM